MEDHSKMPECSPCPFLNKGRTTILEKKMMVKHKAKEMKDIVVFRTMKENLVD